MEQRRLETAYGPVAYRLLDAGARPDGPTTPSGVAVRIPLVLLHGRAADSSQWDGVVSLLDPRAYGPTVLVDLPCHGASCDYEGFSFDRAADHVASIVRAELSAPALVVGHSVGGAVAQLLAARHPAAVASLLVADAAPVEAGVYSAFERFALKRSASSLRVYEERSVRGLAGGMARELCATSAGREALHEIFARRSALELCRLVAIADGDLARFVGRLEEPLAVRCPVTLACGGRDRLNRTARAMRAWARRSGTELLLLDGCGHFCMLDDPEAFVAAMDAARATVGLP